jgi:eukaryotic-like serine/threonine-protein kinase
VDEAIEHLRRAVATCDIFYSTIDHVRAALNLGRALEQKGDLHAACDAYEKVLAQWGKAKPRSVTADAARSRVKAIGCGR